jgi:hypothetical protein
MAKMTLCHLRLTPNETKKQQSEYLDFNIQRNFCKILGTQCLLKTISIKKFHGIIQGVSADGKLRTSRR